jgi:hypothetical protein
MRSGMKKRTSKSSKRKLRTARELLNDTVDSLTLSKNNGLMQRSRLSDKYAGGKISVP